MWFGLQIAPLSFIVHLANKDPLVGAFRRLEERGVDDPLGVGRRRLVVAAATAAAGLGHLGPRNLVVLAELRLRREGVAVDDGRGGVADGHVLVDVVQAGLDASVELRSAEITNTEMISNNRKKASNQTLTYTMMLQQREREKM